MNDDRKSSKRTSLAGLAMRSSKPSFWLMHYGSRKHPEIHAREGRIIFDDALFVKEYEAFNLHQTPVSQKIFPKDVYEMILPVLDKHCLEVSAPYTQPYIMAFIRVNAKKHGVNTLYDPIALQRDLEQTLIDHGYVADREQASGKLKVIPESARDVWVGSEKAQRMGGRNTKRQKTDSLPPVLGKRSHTDDEPKGPASSMSR